MTKVKQILGFVMAALMCFALTPAAAFAADEMGSLKVENAVKGQTYNLYKIADLKTSGTNPTSYSYTPATGWEGFWSNIAAEGNQYGITLSTVGDVTNIVFDGESMAADDSTVAALAVAAKNYDPKPAPAATETAGDNGVTFKGLALGYYFLDSTTGTICSLTSMKPNETIKEKNEFPTIEKTVKENSTNEYGPNNNANIGDTVEFRTVIDVAKGALNYIYHDSMTEGLTFDADSVKVYKGDANKRPSGDPLTRDDYTLSVPEAAHEGWNEKCTFDILFDQEGFLAGLTENDYIVIEYSATLNEKAVISPSSNDNTANLTYGEKNTTTNESKTKTYTGGINVFKQNDAGEGLAGAVFTVSKLENGSNPLAFMQLDETDTRAEAGIPTYRPVVAGEEGITEITTIANGEFKIVGLDEGKYFLTEITAPEGYNKLAAAQAVEVTEGEASVLSFGDAKVVNKTGLELPSTGGMGTTILYIVGAVLVIGAVIFLVRRRSNATK